MDSYLGSASDVASQNRYTYANNNPVNNIDPSGHYSVNVNGAMQYYQSTGLNELRDYMTSAALWSGQVNAQNGFNRSVATAQNTSMFRYQSISGISQATANRYIVEGIAKAGQVSVNYGCTIPTLGNQAVAKFANNVNAAKNTANKQISNIKANKKAQYDAYVAYQAWLAQQRRLAEQAARQKAIRQNLMQILQQSLARSSFNKVQNGLSILGQTLSYMKNAYMEAWNNSRLKPSVMEAAKMAQHIYSASVGDTVKGGWELIEMWNPERGRDLHMGVYARTNARGETGYTIVNRGTASWDNAIDDVQLVFGKSPDAWASIDETKMFIKNHFNDQVTFVGHSKGGAEAALNAVRNNRDVIAFNPAPIAYSSYQLNSYLNGYSSNINVYIIEGEIVDSLFGRMSDLEKGQVIFLKGEEISIWETLMYVFMGANDGYTASKIRNSVKNHSMETIIEALEREGY